MITKQFSVLEPQFLRVPQLVEGGIAAKLHHGRWAAHQHDVVLARGKQALRNHGGVHTTRAVLPILPGNCLQSVPKPELARVLLLTLFQLLVVIQCCREISCQ